MEKKPASRNDQLLAAVLEIANVINSQLDLNNIFAVISKELSRVFDYDLSCVAIYDKDENCLYMRHVSRKNGDKSGENRYVPLEESNLIGWVAIHRQPILRRNIPEDTRFKEIMREDDLKSDIVVPLIAKNTLIGTVNIGSYEYNHFDQFDLDLLVRLSKLTSIAIENSQLLKEVKDLGEKYRVLMKNASDLIILIDATGRIAECNDEVYRVSGYSPEEIIGREVYQLTLPERREEVKDSFCSVLRGELKEVKDLPYFKKNGEIIYLEINTKLVSIKGDTFVLVIARDITERMKLERRIKIQNKELKEINKKLMEIDELKSDFLSRISHELRTPLSIIMAYTGTLMEEMEAERLDEKTRSEFLSVIDSQSKKLLSLIDDLLDLSKVEISETMLDIAEGSINEVIEIAVHVVEPIAEQKGIAIEIDLDDEIPIINFDSIRIRQVLVNLLSNAVKFSREKGVVRISSKDSGSEVVVSVMDSGQGIDDKDIARIFDKFTQVEGINTRESSGMGIGLRLVKHYVELHGGRIWVKSKKGVGSIFCFSLPKVTREINQ